MIKVYIASPYTNGDVATNVRFQMDVANSLMDNGFLPFVPLLLHFQHLVHPRSYQDWLKFDLEWVSACDCVLRLGGLSAGADCEVDYAISLGILVFYSISDLIRHFVENNT